MRTIPTALAVGLLALLALVPSARSEDYPNRPVRMIIAFSAGGSVDALGRILAQKLSDNWGQQVAVENRTGALGNIGAVAAAHAPPDGYTLHLAAQSVAVNVTLASVDDFDPITDLEPIMLVATAQDILIVPPNSPFKTVHNLIDYAKANPGKLTYGTLGTSSSGNMAMAVFCEPNGRLKMQQIAYSQSSQLTADVMSGRIDTFFPTTGAHVANVASGRERALGVSGPRRAAQIPDVPTFAAESGVTYPDATSWYAMFAPKGTPRDVILKVNRDIEHVLALPDVKALEDKLGFITIGGPPAKLTAFLKSEIDKWAMIAKDPLFLGK
ncbi:MAG: tripartite tricarboxylate transporter substrate binding protein [Xanthobacteraceae bacterium]